MRRALRVPVLVGGMLLVAACGGDGAPGSQSSVTSEAVPSTTIDTSTTAVPTSEGAETTTSVVPDSTSSTTGGDATSTTIEEPAGLRIDREWIRGVAPAQLPDGSEALLSGAPNEAAAAALLAELGETGVDLLGVEVWVWPVSGTSDALLVLEADDDAAGLAEDPGAADALLPAIVESSVLDTAGVTRIVINYRGVDGDGPYTFTATFSLDAARAAMRGGFDIPQDEIAFQLSRGL